MVNTARVTIYQYAGRHSVNLPSDFVKDSTFPFRPKEELLARIEGDKIILERAPEAEGGESSLVKSGRRKR